MAGTGSLEIEPKLSVTGNYKKIRFSKKGGIMRQTCDTDLDIYILKMFIIPEQPTKLTLTARNTHQGLDVALLPAGLFV